MAGDQFPFIAHSVAIADVARVLASQTLHIVMPSVDLQAVCAMAIKATSIDRICCALFEQVHRAIGGGVNALNLVIHTGCEGPVGPLQLVRPRYDTGAGDRLRAERIAAHGVRNVALLALGIA